MDYGPYFQPQSIAPILERATAQQLPLVASPKGLSNVAGTLGDVAKTGFDVAAQNDKKKSVLAAQQGYSDYLAKVRSGTATEADHAQGSMYAMSLGLPQMDTTKNDLEKAQTANFKSETSARDSKDAAFTPEVANAIRKKLGMPASTDPLKPSDIPGLKLSAPTTGADDMKVAKMWQSQINNILPTIAKRGSPLGIAAVNNQRKDRLLQIANNPNPSPQEISLMEVDLAGVMQGGSPQEDTLRATQYKNYYRDWASFKGRFTGTPQDANDPEVVAKLKSLALGVGSVDNKVITDNMKMIENYPSMTYLIKKDPQGWTKFKQTLMGTLQTGDGASAPATGSGSNPPAGYTLHTNKKTGQTAYINAQGDIWQQ